MYNIYMKRIANYICKKIPMNKIIKSQKFQKSALIETTFSF